MPVDWMHKIRENKDSSDLSLSRGVIEGDILMLWKTGGRTDLGPMGSGNQEMLIERPPGDSRLCVPGAEASGFNRNVWNVWERRSV